MNKPIVVLSLLLVLNFPINLCNTHVPSKIEKVRLGVRIHSQENHDTLRKSIGLNK